MILLENKANTLPPDTDYPYGAIKNDTGVGDGTPVDFQVYNDIHQFFSHLFAKSSITANGLPDNLTNGFQLYEAFEKLLGLQAWADGVAPTITTSTPGATVVFHSTPYSKFKIMGKTLVWNFVAGVTCTGSPTVLRVNLPTAVTFPGTLLGSGGLTVGGRYHTGAAIVNINNSGVTIEKPDGTAMSNVTGARLTFSFTIEIA